jgi:hypothetical protein
MKFIFSRELQYLSSVKKENLILEGITKYLNSIDNTDMVIFISIKKH